MAKTLGRLCLNLSQVDVCSLLTDNTRVQPAAINDIRYVGRRDSIGYPIGDKIGISEPLEFDYTLFVPYVSVLSAIGRTG